MSLYFSMEKRVKQKLGFGFDVVVNHLSNSFVWRCLNRKRCHFTNAGSFKLGLMGGEVYPFQSHYSNISI